MLRCMIAMAALTFATGGAAQPAAHPQPDPGERSAFQRRELARRFQELAIPLRRADARSRMQDRFDVLSYRLELDLRRPEERWLLGEVGAAIRITKGPLDTLLLDLHDNMTVDSVFVGDAPAQFEQDFYDLRILPGAALGTGDTARVQIHYQGHPMQTGFAAFVWGSRQGVPLIWTLSEPTGAREWWPCKDRPDDKADRLEVVIHTPDWMTTTSNGILTEDRAAGDGFRSVVWRHDYPIATYLVSVCATDYERLEDRYIRAPGDTLPIEHFVYPEHRLEAEEDFSITPAALGVFERLFGPYPFRREKYGHTVFAWGGAMEHQTNTSYGAGLIRGDHAYDWILVHELAHQWWGDMVSPADWRDIWLNEGFASYGEALWAEHLEGAEGLRRYMTEVQIVLEPSGPVYDPINLFDASDVYNKGAWVLHMLRGIVGDTLFFATLDAYRDRTAYRSTTTDEFAGIAEEVCARDLDFFFEPWLYGGGRPTYRISFLPIGGEATPGAAIHIGQEAAGAYFPMPVDLEVDLAGGGSIRWRVYNDPDQQDYEIDLPAPPVRVRLDPDDWILKHAKSEPYGLNITTTRLPPGTADSLYEAPLMARGGEPPYRWTAQDPLPDGLVLDEASGRLQGTAPDSGRYIISAVVRDRSSRTDAQRLVLSVGAPQAGDSVIVDPHRSLSLRAGPIPARAWIGFRIEGPAGEAFRLEVFDLQGRSIRELWSGSDPGRPIQWDGRDREGRPVPSGAYWARLEGASSSISRPVVWIR